METALTYFNFTVMIYFVCLFFWYLINYLLTCPWLFQHYEEEAFGNIDELMQQCAVPITLIIPMFNEEKRIFNAVYGLLKNHYQNIHIIVVNDGSTDRSLQMMKKEFACEAITTAFPQTLPSAPVKQYYQSRHYPQLILIDKEHAPTNNGADAHNAGLNATTTPIVVTFDADTLLEPDALTRLLFHFLANRHCIAAGGAVYVLNGNHVEHGKILTRRMPRAFLPASQWIEYLRSFTFGRTGLNSLSGAQCYPGAFTMFETKALKEFGGFDATNYSYDAEVTIRFQHYMRRQRYPTHVRFVASAMAWTTVPDTLKSLWNQRNRWQRGMLLSVWLHKRLLFNPFYGQVGLITFPAYIVFEIFGPVIECLAYFSFILSYALGIAHLEELIWFWLLAWGSLVLMTLGTFYLSALTFESAFRFSNVVRVLGLLTAEMFGLRQFKAYCCFYGTVQFIVNRLRGKRL